MHIAIKTKEEQKVIKTSGEFFSVKDTLECGQIFRFTDMGSGRYFVISGDKACIAYNEQDNAVIECEAEDEEYFTNFFDLKRDYSGIYNAALKENVPFLTAAAEKGKGIRILNQNKEEMLFSFIVSQNNNIPRIKKILGRTADALGEKRTFKNIPYGTFPTATVMSEYDQNFYAGLGVGYRAAYIKQNADKLSDGYDLNNLDNLTTPELKKELLSLYGVGPKVADCISLFAFHRTDSFPVDTWIEKVYKEDFSGKETDRKKIAEYFTERFGDNSGYVQQYVFNYKRNVEARHSGKDE